MFRCCWEHVTRRIARGSELRYAPEHEFETGTAGSNLLEDTGTYSLKGAAMTQADHYRDQSNRAKRLAKAVKDPEASQKLSEMAEEFRLYAERLEQTH